jgi:hypothetical protein
MQILADFEPPKFRSEGRPAREGASRMGACPRPVAGAQLVTSLTAIDGSQDGPGRGL